MNEYYVIAIISVVITLLAQGFVSFTYRKYKGVLNLNKTSGLDTAKLLLLKHDLSKIYVVETKGNLTDHYDPTNNVIRLSTDIYHGTSIASVAVAAHEVGHAIQNKEGNIFMKIRSGIYPIVNFCSKIGYLVIIISLILGYMKLFYFGIAMLFIILLFQILTLPVEFDASRKAIKNIKDQKILNDEEVKCAKVILFAAALTYVASLATTVLEIFRLLLMGRNDR